VVQNTRGKVWDGIIDRLLRLFHRNEIVEAPLEFNVSTEDQGRHMIEAYLIIEGQRRKVTNIRELWNYGSSLELDNKHYVLDGQSLNTLLSIKSMNPEVTDDGKIISEVYPTVLQYLRKRGGVKEDPTSKRIGIMKTPLKHRAEVSYNPQEGVWVKAGYDVPGAQGVVQLSEFQRSPEGEYVQFSGSFYRLPRETPPVREWVEAQEKLVGLVQVPDFFKRDLILLKNNFNTVLTEQAGKIEIIEAKFKPIFKVDIDARGWLDFEIDYSVGQYQLPHDLFKNAKPSHIRPDENTWIQVDCESVKETDEQLEALDPTQTEGGYRIEITRFLSLEDVIEKLGGIRKVSAEYQRFLDSLTSFEYKSSFKLPLDHENTLATNGIKLRPYQRAGIHWLSWLMRRRLNGILADDMGLGKTIQTIAAMRLAYGSPQNPSPSLIVCPKSVIGHWRREIQRVYPNISVYPYVGESRDAHRFTWRKPTIFVTTYATMSRDLDFLSKIPFFFVVLDEGTRIKNPDVKRAVAAKALNAAHRLVLSGTPIENRPVELWSIFDFLMKGHLGSYGRFVSQYEKPIQEDDSDAVKELSKRIKPFILRRLKEDVAEELPEKIEMPHWCGLTDEQKSLYSQIQKKYVSTVRKGLLKGEYVNYATSVLPIITKLKQVCDHPALITGERNPLLGRSEKFDLIIDIIQEILKKKEAAVLFSYFLGALDLFESHLRDKEVSYIRIDGSTQNRQELIDKFNEGKASIALCSLMASSQGINLTSASHVIHVDRWWNPAIEDQATDRVHRIGQTKTVYVYKVLTEGTLEEKIDDLLESKRDLTDNVIRAATKEVKAWTREELLEILKPIE